MCEIIVANSLVLFCILILQLSNMYLKESEKRNVSIISKLLSKDRISSYRKNDLLNKIRGYEGWSLMTLGRKHGYRSWHGPGPWDQRLYIRHISEDWMERIYLHYDFFLLFLLFAFLLVVLYNFMTKFL
jgi:hypothetical protein